jgi:hypothetical protein
VILYDPYCELCQSVPRGASVWCQSKPMYQTVPADDETVRSRNEPRAFDRSAHYPGSTRAAAAIGWIRLTIGSGSAESAGFHESPSVGGAQIDNESAPATLDSLELALPASGPLRFMRRSPHKS